ncbi:MAG: peptidoglycan D,D-transpeptidase FtsI family protein [Acidimicrobiales bacterium]
MAWRRVPRERLFGDRRRPPRQRLEVAVRRSRRRVAVLGACFAALFGVTGLKLVDLQVLRSAGFIERSLDQRVRVRTLPADRGSILDRNSNELAVSVERAAVAADPALVGDPRAAAAQLAPLLELPEPELEALLRSPGRFVHLKRGLDDAAARRVKDLGMAGLIIQRDPTRFAPAGDLGLSVLGRTNVDNVGISGIELQYDELLKGQPGKLLYERAEGGQTIAIGEREFVPAVRGGDVVLTLDRRVQHLAERELEAAIRQYDAAGGQVVVSNPRTGEILAMANMAGRAEPEIVGQNLALTSQFEPGSVGKLVAFTAALEDGAITPESQFTIGSSIRVADDSFRDSHDNGGQRMTATEILAKSSNIGTIQIAQKLGKDRMYEELVRFGFGARTGVGFPNEEAGILPAPGKWSGTSIATIPIGQGLAVTAVQMLAAYNAIANDGEWVAPNLVKEVVANDRTATPAAAPERRRVTSPEVANTLNHMLRGVVTEGTGRAAAVEGFTVAGKTGTAWKPQPTGGYHDRDGVVRYVSSFVGFLPAEDPQLSVMVVIDDPRGAAYSGGQVAAPPFASIARQTALLLGLAPAAASPPDVVNSPTPKPAPVEAPAPPPAAAASPTTTAAPADKAASKPASPTTSAKPAPAKAAAAPKPATPTTSAKPAQTKPAQTKPAQPKPAPSRTTSTSTTAPPRKAGNG